MKREPKSSTNLTLSILNFLSISIAVCFFQFCLAQESLNQYSLVITNASIVDVVSGKVSSHRLLAISGDTIKAIDDTRKVNRYKADKYVNAQNRYILPGLWDMHVHFRGGDTLINENKALLPLFLAYGITAIRDAGGDITSAVLHWKKEIATGEMAGPKIFTSGPKIDGHKRAWPGSLRVETPDEVSRGLDSLKRLGADYVKLYNASLSREAFLNAIEQAEKRGLKTTGHIPLTVKVAEAAAAGLDAIEHMLFVFMATSSKEDSIMRLAQAAYQSEKPLNIFSVLPIAYETYSPESASSIIATLADANMGVVPTLYIEKVIVELKETDHSQDSLLRYIDPKIQATYKRNLVPGPKGLYEAFLNLIPQMQAAGVLLLAGSDCGPFNSFIYPGHSLHEELKVLVTAGLTPVQALQAATINSAAFMGVDNFYGTIQAGKSSDLIIINRNPLNNIGAIDDIRMVVAKGRLYSKDDLDHLLQTIKH